MFNNAFLNELMHVPAQKLNFYVLPNIISQEQDNEKYSILTLYINFS